MCGARLGGRRQTSVTLVLRRLRQEDPDFKAKLKLHSGVLSRKRDGVGGTSKFNYGVEWEGQACCSQSMRRESVGWLNRSWLAKKTLWASEDGGPLDAEPIYVEMPREDMVLALWFLDTLSYLDCLPSPAVSFEELSSDCRYTKRPVTRAAKHAGLLTHSIYHLKWISSY